MHRDGETTGSIETLLQRGYRYALALTHDEGRAEDLLHDALVSILERGIRPNPGYLMTTIRNRFIDRYRRARRLAMGPLDEEDPPAADGPSPMSDDIDRERLDAALATLRPVEREVLHLTYVEDHTTREIAEITGQPRNSILSLLHRAREKLRRRLGDGSEVRS